MSLKVLLPVLLIAGSNAYASATVYGNEELTLYGGSVPVTQSMINFAGYHPSHKMQSQAEKLCLGPATFVDAAIVTDEETGARQVGYRFLCL